MVSVDRRSLEGGGETAEEAVVVVLDVGLGGRLGVHEGALAAGTGIHSRLQAPGRSLVHEQVVLELVWQLLLDDIDGGNHMAAVASASAVLE